MSRNKKVLLALVLFLAVWVPTLGLHWFDAMRVYCRNCDAEGSLRVWAFVRPEHRFLGIPFLLGLYHDRLPYPLDLAITADDQIAGSAVRLRSVRIEYADGEVVELVGEGGIRTGELVPFEPWNAKETPERSFRRARFAFPDAVPYRDDFELVIEGTVGDGERDATTTVERRLRIEPDKERALVTGWEFIEGAGV